MYKANKYILGDVKRKLVLAKYSKQFCIHGHDIFIVGRCKNRACKECERIRHKKFYDNHLKYRQNCSQQNRNLIKYGLSRDEYNNLFTKQNGKCAICKISQDQLSKTLAVDHNHITQKVRGLLCTKCNLMLGFAADRIEILQAAMEYLNLK